MKYIVILLINLITASVLLNAQSSYETIAYEKYCTTKRDIQTTPIQFYSVKKLIKEMTFDNLNHYKTPYYSDSLYKYEVIINVKDFDTLKTIQDSDIDKITKNKLTGLYKVISGKPNQEYDYYIGCFFRGSSFLYFKDNVYEYYKEGKLVKQQYFVNLYPCPAFKDMETHDYKRFVEDYYPVSQNKYKRVVLNCIFKWEIKDILRLENNKVLEDFVIDSKKGSYIDGIQYHYQIKQIPYQNFGSSADSLKISVFRKGKVVKNTTIRRVYKEGNYHSQDHEDEDTYYEYKNLKPGTLISGKVVNRITHDVMFEGKFLVLDTEYKSAEFIDYYFNLNIDSFQNNHVMPIGTHYIKYKGTETKVGDSVKWKNDFERLVTYKNGHLASIKEQNIPPYMFETPDEFGYSEIKFENNKVSYAIKALIRIKDNKVLEVHASEVDEKEKIKIEKYFRYKPWKINKKDYR